MIEIEEVGLIEEKGFSLVEVLATVAILSFLIFAICTFMTTSSNLYNKSSQEIDLQQEAQTTLNQLNDIILSANKFGVSYINKGLDNEVAVIYIQSIEEINTKVNYCIIWTKEKGKLYFIKKDDTFTFSGTESEITSLYNSVTDEANLMGEYIQSMEISQSTDKQSVSITLIFNINDDHYEMTKQIKFRNKQE